MRWSSPIVFNDLEECQFTPFTKEQYITCYKAYIKILTDCAKGQSTHDVAKFSDVCQLIIQVMKFSMEQGTFDEKYFGEIFMTALGNPESDYRNYTNTAFIKCFRILCVTEKFDNNLMWAHYAAEHYGCVIELASLYTEKPPFLREGFVRYHENLQPHSNPLDMLLYGETEEVRDLMIRDVAFSKRTSWSYENEYRLMFPVSFGEIRTKIDMTTKQKEIVVKDQSDKLYNDVGILQDSIKSVIFGVRTTDADIKKVLDVLSENNYHCNAYQMKMRDGQMKKEEIL